MMIALQVDVLSKVAFFICNFFLNFHLEAWNLTDETKHGLNEQQRCFKDPSLCGDC